MSLRRKLETQKARARRRFLRGELHHEGYYTEEKTANRRAKKLNGYVKHHRRGLYAGSYEVFAPLPLWARIRYRRAKKDRM